MGGAEFGLVDLDGELDQNPHHSADLDIEGAETGENRRLTDYCRTVDISALRAVLFGKKAVSAPGLIFYFMD